MMSPKGDPNESLSFAKEGRGSVRQREVNGSRAVSDEAESLKVPGVGRSSDWINGETRKHTNTTAIAMGRDQGTTNSGTRKNTPKQQKNE